MSGHSDCGAEHADGTRKSEKEMCTSVKHWNEWLPVVQFKCPGVNIDFVKLEVVLEIQQQMRHVCVGKMLAVSRHSFAQKLRADHNFPSESGQEKCLRWTEPSPLQRQIKISEA